jgi:hypothetical protein
MARNAATQVEQNFTKGLITEATGLNYPENSCIETWDCEFDFFGRVARRLAMDLEFGSDTTVVTKTSAAINTYHWRNVTGDGTTQFIVVQVGGTLYFYDTTNPNSLSEGLLASTITLSTYTPVGAPAAGLYDCHFADGLGKLYIFHPYLENFYVTYSAGVVSGTAYSLKIRDFEGAVNDPRGLETRPTESLATMLASDQIHAYNLYNQGWPQDNLYLSAWDVARTDMPSNCDVWWNFKNASDAFDMTTVVNSGRGNSPAPKGRFIWNAYNIDRASIVATTGNTTSGTARTSTGAFHAGRVFYAGVNATGYTSKIYFSQIIERDEQAGFCYQANDPTSEDLFDLLPADGGVIAIPEAGTIYKLFSIANGLIVFGYRGVWFITGSTGIGFTATDFTVTRLSSIRTVSGTSFVDVNGVPMWWNTDGIFTVQSGQGGPQVQSMSISTIQSFYNSIPNASKTAAKGYFNPVAQTVQWLFRTTPPGTVEEQNSFDAILNYNVLTNAFFPWTIQPGCEVHGLIVVDGTGGLLSEVSVVDDAAVQVVDDLGENVVAYELTASGVVPRSKFLVSFEDGGTQMTWAEHNSETYTEWSSLGLNVDYESYFVTGYKLHGQGLTKFAPMYVVVYHEGVGQAHLQGIWDYAVSTSTGRFTTTQYMNFDDTNYTNQSKRVKIRGQGKTLQYKVSSLSGEPFNIVGWSSFETGNTAP